MGPPMPGHDPRIEAAIAKLGERLPPPKPGVRRVLVLDLADGTGRSDLKGTAPSLSDAVRRTIASHDAYEVVDAGIARDLARYGFPEAALAAVTHSGAVISGSVFSQRDSSVAAVALIHDAQRGFPFSVRTPRIAPTEAPGALAESLGASLFKALDKVRWAPNRPTVPKP
jgi:hypothetical protein